MPNLKIRNFGPINRGLTENNGFFEIPQATVFIGPQGSGKSSVAKLLSTFLWLEKALVKEDIKESQVRRSFKTNYCNYHGLLSYFRNDTEIAYEGERYSFHYRNGQLTIQQSVSTKYLLPRIMYVPAERNFLSIFPQASSVRKLPRPLSDFLTEFDNARMSRKGSVSLPIPDLKFEYDKLNKASWVVRNGEKTRLEHAASGFQSLIPMYLTSIYLSNSLDEKKDASRSDMTVDEIRLVRKAIREIMKAGKEETLKALDTLSSQIQARCFINIVEEPEQNLYPDSQASALNALLSHANKTAGNRLVVTTHSPYLINALTLAIKGAELKKLLPAEKRNELHSIVPPDSCIDGSKVKIYQMNDNGGACELERYKNLPSDENLLNCALAQFNDSFNLLLDLEESCR